MLPNITAVLTAAGALVAVLVMIAAVARLARYGGFAAQRTSSSGRSLAIEETVALDARRRLVLVRCSNDQVLLLTGGAQDVVVGWLRAEKPDR